MSDAQPVIGSWEALLANAQRLQSRDDAAALPALQQLLDRLNRLSPAQLSAGQGHLAKLRLSAGEELLTFHLRRQRFDDAYDLTAQLAAWSGPQLAALWNHRAIRILVMAGKAGQAVALLRSRADAAPDDSDAWGELALLQIELGQLNDAALALKQVERAISRGSAADTLAADRAYLAYVATQLALARRDWEQAVAWHQNACAFDASYARASHRLYTRLIRAGESRRALPFLEQKGEPFARVGLWKGIAAMQQGERAAAERTWVKVTKTKAATGDAGDELAWILCHYYLGDKQGVGLARALMMLKNDQTVRWWHYFCVGLGWALRGSLVQAHANFGLAVTLRRINAESVKMPAEGREFCADLLAHEVLSEVESYFDAG